MCHCKLLDLLTFSIFQSSFNYLWCDDAGCMAALDAEHYLQEVGAQEEKYD